MEAPGITKTFVENIVIKQSVIFAITASMQETQGKVRIRRSCRVKDQDCVQAVLHHGTGVPHQCTFRPDHKTLFFNFQKCKAGVCFIFIQI